MSFSFCNKHVLAQRLGYSHHTLKTIRQRGDWIEGVHYVRPNANSRVIRYNLELCLHWLANQHNIEAHRKEIERYLMSLQGEKLRKAKE
ncbi:MAG: excisionase family protein [Trichocoleus desertorum ATA4-8-CV12]|jgi:hypothetical protein|nr:excisionase family protein [Trichocoleus desertorum ATA4-8-CV12]